MTSTTSARSGRDERVLAEAFYQGVEFTYRLMKALSGTR
jgi:hypothetical protein